MHPVHSITNERSQSISDAFLREKYRIPEGEAFPEALLLARKFEKASQAMTKLEQTEKKLSNGITRLEEGSKILRAQQADLIELEKKNTQALQNLAKSSSELREITSNIANVVSNCANRIFNPIRNGVRNGFYFLTGHREPREPAEVLPKENQLAIEDNPGNTISNTDPTNQPSVNEKKNCINLLKFFMIVGGFYVLYSKAQKIFWCSSVNPHSS